MRKSILLLGLIGHTLYAQTPQELIDAETRSYQKKAAFRTNPNAANYNLQYQRLELTLNPAVREVAGKVTSHFTPKALMKDLYMDLDQALTVSQVTRYNPTTKVNDNLVFSQAGTELKITYATGFAATKKDSVSVTYAGTPPTANKAFMQDVQSGTSKPILSTLSEPYGAKDWFPTKESLDDKIDRVDMIITSPKQYYAAANGYLKSRTINANNNTATTWWRTNYPIPAYLVAFGLSEYSIKEDVIGPAGATFPFVNYIYPSTANNASLMANINSTKAYMDLLISKFGDYPFKKEKYGHMEFSWGGGMEHSTMSSMGTWDRSTIMHELGHQWFGDMVTCSSWNDIWINEGFAVFTEHLLSEFITNKNNAAGFRDYLNGELDKIKSVNGSTYIPEANPVSDRIFSGELTYAKGGYIARMLKWVLGEANFYTGMKNFLNKHAYSYASTANLQTELEAVHGSSLKYFFDQWVYGKGYPTYAINYNQTANKNASFEINQTSSDPSVSFFKMPVPLKITGTGGQILNVVYNNSQNAQIFFQNIPFAISKVEVDFDLQMISGKNTVTKKTSQNTLSTDDISFPEDKISLYPIPSSSEIYISGLEKPTVVQIYNTEAKLLESIDYQPNTAINIAHLASGVYFASIEGHLYKFIKQ